MISAYAMTVYVQPDMRACASAILDLLLRWPPTPPAQTTVTQVNLPQDGAGAACTQLPPTPPTGAARGRGVQTVWSSRSGSQLQCLPL
jgi:hypothetical protein